MKGIFYSIIVFLFSVLNVQAQELSQHPDSISNVQKETVAVKKPQKLSASQHRKLAQAYMNDKQFKLAEEQYASLVLSQQATEEDFFNYVLILQTNGHYTKALSNLHLLQALSADNTRKKTQEKLQELSDLMASNDLYKINNLSVNTPYDEYAPSYAKSRLIVFSSTAKRNALMKSIFKFRGDLLSDLVESKAVRDDLEKPNYFNYKWAKKNSETSTSFIKNGSYMAYTVSSKNKNADDGSQLQQIFFKQKKRGKWLEPEPFVLNSENYSVAYPSFNSSGKILFFASDMPGGYGGMDLYFVKQNSKEEWSEPYNLGERINTKGDETYPFYDSNTGFLFFSSNGREGLGGFDNYVATKLPDGFGWVENLGSPINSSFDDFALVAYRGLKKGYFTSNRDGGKGGNDIYSYAYQGEYREYVPIDSIHSYKYVLHILNEETMQPIPKARVMLDVVPIMTDSTALVSSRFDANSRFEVAVTATGYVDTVLHVDIKHQQESEIITDTLLMRIDKNRRIVLNDILYDYGKTSILPEAELELDKLVSFMAQNPQLQVELSSHTDSRSSDKFNLQLSQGRAKSATAYIVSRGINASRITAVGYGETRLVNQCVNGVDCTEEQHQQNRRTEVFIQDYTQEAK